MSWEIVKEIQEELERMHPQRGHLERDYDLGYWKGRMEALKWQWNQNLRQLIHDPTSSTKEDTPLDSHSCEFLLEDKGCDVGQKDGCEYTTLDQKCSLLIHSSEPKVNCEKCGNEILGAAIYILDGGEQVCSKCLYQSSRAKEMETE